MKSLEERCLFKELDPPPGGVERFRRRLEERSEPTPARRRPLAIAGLAVAAAVLLVVFAVTSHEEDSEPRFATVYEAPEFDRLLGRPMGPAAFSVSINGKTALVSRIPSEHEKIRIYEIEIETD